MTDHPAIQLSPEIAAAVAVAASWRGLSVERYASDVLARAAGLDAELAAAIKEGEDDLAAGLSYTQEQVETMFKVRREQRRAA